jgi:hypothetical protein
MLLDSQRSTKINLTVLGLPDMNDEKKVPETPVGNPLAFDPSAASASQTEPGF